jgi:hypothetical protein
VAALQEDIIVRSESRVLELARQYEHELDGDATDDEVCKFYTIADTILTCKEGRHDLSSPILSAKQDESSWYSS